MANTKGLFSPTARRDFLPMSGLPTLLMGGQTLNVDLSRSGRPAKGCFRTLLTSPSCSLEPSPPGSPPGSPPAPPFKEKGGTCLFSNKVGNQIKEKPKKDFLGLF